jgi:hypothetical protein
MVMNRRRSRACCIALREGHRAKKVKTAVPWTDPGSDEPVVEAEEIHSLAPDPQPHDPGLGRLWPQTEVGQQSSHPRQRGMRLPLRPTHHQHIVGLCGPVDYADRGVTVLVDGVIRVEWSA